LIVEEMDDGGAKAKANALLPPVGTRSRWRRADTTIFDFDDDIATMAIIGDNYSNSNLVLQHPT